MQKLPVKVMKLSHFKGELPSYQTHYASGFDVRAQIDDVMVVAPGERKLVPTGLSFEIPIGYEIQVRPRSGWALKQGVTVLNTPGTIDADYRGEVKVIVVNLGQEPVEIRSQDRIAQFILCPVLQAELILTADLSESARGLGGFGSTGI